MNEGVRQVRNYLEKRGLTIRDLARSLEVTESHLGMILQGHRRPSPKLALKIEKITGADFKKVLFGE